MINGQNKKVVFCRCGLPADKNITINYHSKIFNICQRCFLKLHLKENYNNTTIPNPNLGIFFDE